MNWYFGENAGLTFTPTLLANTLGQVNTAEGCATISDSCGNLLFYTDGITVYTKNHTVMQNGTNLFSNQSSSQAALIVPKPLNDSIYYIFTTAGSNVHFCYSTLNIKLNGGLGAVISKNDTICFSAGEKLAAVHHCNGTDIWVVVKKPFFKHIYYSFLVSSSGINLNPVVSIQPYIPSSDDLGYLKFSPNGAFMANAHVGPDSVSLLTFNNCTGQLTHLMSFFADTTVYGLSFSPDNTKLYTSNSLLSTVQKSHIYQYNVSSGVPATILSSKTLIHTLPDSVFFGALQMGPDDKIYTTQFHYTNGYNVPFLSVINNPNSTGIACNYQNNSFSLSGKNAQIGLPNFIESYFNTSYNCLVGVGFKESNFEKDFSVFPNPFSIKTNIQLFNQTIRRIELYNSYGCLIRHIDNINSDNIEIERGNLETGIYFLQIKTDKNITQTYRLVIE